MSPSGIRRIFEATLIFGELQIAQRSLGQLLARRVLQESEAEALERLCLWTTGETQEVRTIDLSRVYFEVYPAHDQWFKGMVCLNTGRLAEAKEHFQKCLTLAPPNAFELRDDVQRRLADIAASMCRK